MANGIDPYGRIDPIISYLIDSAFARAKQEVEIELARKTRNYYLDPYGYSPRLDPYFYGPAFPLASEPAPVPPAMEESTSLLGVVVAYRKWELDQAGRFLASHNKYFWEPFSAAERVCSETVVTEYKKAGLCKEERCSCGFYGWLSDEKIKPSDWEKRHLRQEVRGPVNLWGKIYEHEKGYRGEFAYPKSFYNEGQPFLAELSARYGVPIEEPTWKLDTQKDESTPLL